MHAPEGHILFSVRAGTLTVQTIPLELGCDLRLKLRFIYFSLSTSRQIDDPARESSIKGKD
jgi:hypothetical protein